MPRHVQEDMERRAVELERARQEASRIATELREYGRRLNEDLLREGVVSHAWSRNAVDSIIREDERGRYESQIRAIETLVDRVLDARREGDYSGARVLVQQLKEALEALASVRKAEAGLAAAGASAGLQRAALSAFDDLTRQADTVEDRTLFRARAGTILRAAEMYSANQEALERNAELKALLERTILSLGEGSMQDSRESARGCRRFTARIEDGLRAQLGQMDSELKKLGEFIRQADSMALEAASERCMDLMGSVAGILREAANALRKDAEEARKGLQGGGAAETPIRALEARMSFLERARKLISEAKHDERLENILGRGLAALNSAARMVSGKKDEAAELEKRAGMQMLFAERFSQASEAERRDLEAGSSRMQSGQITVAAAGSVLARSIGTSLRSFVRGPDAISDQACRGTLARVSESLEGSHGAAELRLAMEAVDVARRVREQERRMARRAPMERRQSMEMMRRALEAASSGEQASAALQMRLAESYAASSPEQRVRISSASAGLDAERTAAADQESLGGETARRRMRVLEERVGEELFLIQSRDEISRLSRGRGRREREMYDAALASIDSMIDSLARGAEIDDARRRGVFAQAMMFRGDPQGIASAFVSGPGQAGVASSEGLIGVSAALSAAGGARDEAAGIYSRGFQALSAGNLDEAAVFFGLGQAFASDRAGRARLMHTVGELGAGPALAGDRLEAAGRISRAWLEREDLGARIRDARARADFIRYSDISISAYEGSLGGQGPQAGGAESLAALARLYGRAASLGPGEPEARRILALREGDQGLGVPSLAQLGAAPPGAAGALLGAGGSPGGFAIGMAGLELGLERAEFRRKGFEVESGAARSRYRNRAASIEGMMAQAEKRQEQAEVDRLSELRGIVDLRRTAERLAKARADHQQGADLVERALELRRRALEAGGADGERLAAEADGAAGRGRLLMESGEGEQAALLGLHRSVVGIFTRRWWSGIGALDGAAYDYSRAADAIRSGSGGERSLIDRGNERLQSGVMEAGRQLQIQRAVGSLLDHARRLGEENERNAIYDSVDLPAAGGNPPEKAYDHTGRQREIERGRNLAKAERIGESQHWLGVAGGNMRADSLSARVALRNRSLMGYASAGEVERGRLEYFDAQGLLGRLRLARGDVARGRFQNANRMMGEVAEDSIVLGRQQDLNNKANQEDEIARQADARSADFRGWLGRRYEAERTAASRERNGRPQDQARLRALKGNLDAIENLGVSGNLASDASSEADGARERAARLRVARDAVLTSADVADDSIAPQLLDAVVSLEEGRRQLQRAGRGGLSTLYSYEGEIERLAQLLRAGGESAMMDQIRSNPRLMELAAAELRRRGAISEGAESGLSADSRHSRGVAEYQDHATAWNVSVTAAERFVETFGFADQLRRARPGEWQVRESVRSHGSRFLRLALYASREPGRVAGDIASGRSITLPGIGNPDGSGFRVRSGDEVYDDVYINAAPSSATIAGAWRDSSRGVLDSLQTFGQGFAPPMEARTEDERRLRAELGETVWRLAISHHTAARTVADADLSATFASWGYYLPGGGEGARRIRTTPEEAGALSDWAASVASARGQFTTIVAQLKTFASHDERGEAFAAIEDDIHDSYSLVRPILDPAQGGSAGGSGRAAAEIRAGEERRLSIVEGRIRDGLGDDKIVVWTETGAKIIGYGALAASGYGLPVALAGAADTIASSEEQRVMAGGVGQMTESELWLRRGGYAVAGLGVVTAGASEVIGLAGSEAVAASRPLSLLQRGATAASWTMIGGGTLLGLGEVANLAINGGPDVGFGDYAFAFFNAAQPWLQIGGARVMASRPSLMYGTSAGSMVYRGFMAGLFGVGREGLVAARNFEIAAQRERIIRAAPPAHREAILSVGSSLERAGLQPIQPYEEEALLRHYSGSSEIDPVEAARLLRGYRDFVASAEADHPAASHQLDLIEMEIGRPLDPAERYALIRNYADRIPGPAEALRFIERSRHPFTISEYARSGGAGGEGPQERSARARTLSSSRTELGRTMEGGPDGFRPAWDRESEYPLAQRDIAIDAAAAADYIVHFGGPPPGLPAETAALARELAGTGGSVTRFREASMSRGGPDRQTQMRLALQLTDRLPRFIESALDRALVPTMERLAAERGFGRAEESAATVRGQALAEGYIASRSAGAGGAGGDGEFIRSLGGLSVEEAGRRIAAKACSDTADIALSREVEAALTARGAGSDMVLRAQRLAEAFHEYSEAGLLSRPEKAALIAQTRQRLGITDSENAFLLACSGMSAHGAALEIVRVAGGTIGQVISLPSMRAEVAEARLEGTTGLPVQEAGSGRSRSGSFSTAVPLERIPSDVATAFRIAGLEERQIFEAAFGRRGEEPVDTVLDGIYAEIGKGTGVPADASSFEALVAALERAPDRARRIGGLRAAGKVELATSLEAVFIDPEPSTRARAAAEWQRASMEAERVRRIGKALQSLTPEAIARSDRELLRRSSAALGYDADIMAEVFSEGGSAGRARVLDAMGVNAFERERAALERAGAGLAEMERQLGGMNLDDPRSEQLRQRIASSRGIIANRQAQYDAMVEGLFRLVLGGGLQQRINELEGFGGTHIVSASHIGGLRGVTRLELSDGRKLFVKMEDCEPPALGAALAREEGLVTSAIHSGYSFETGVAYVDPQTGKRAVQRVEFGILENIEDLQGKRTAIRLPDGSEESVSIMGVSMLRDRALNHPDAGDSVQALFYDMLSTADGRARLFRAWRAYHEMSRRALLIDRYSRNTAIMVARRDSGEVEITFQPIDLDAIGSRIYRNPRTGELDLAFFNQDFADATASFMLDLLNSSAAAARIKRPDGTPLFHGDPLTLEGLYREMSGPEAARGAAIAGPSPAAMERARDAARRHEGSPFGIGFDTSLPDKIQVGGIVLQSGRARVVERSDGRVAMHAQEHMGAVEAVRGRQADFAAAYPSLVETALVDRVLRLAERLASGESVSADAPGYGIARAAADAPGFNEADAAMRRRIIRSRMVSGDEEPVELGDGDIIEILPEADPRALREAGLRNLDLGGADDASMRARRLTEAFEGRIPSSLDESGRRFVELLHEAGMEADQAADEIAARAASEAREEEIARELENAVPSDLSAEGIIDAQRLAEAFHEYEEASLLGGGRQKAERMAETRRRFGITDSEDSFLLARSGMASAEIAREIAAYIRGR